MLRRLATALLVAAASPGVAHAQGDEGYGEDGDPQAPRRPAHLSADLLDPQGHTRFQLTSRFTPSGPEGTISNDSRLTFMARAHVQAFEGLAVSAALPLGVAVARPGPDAFFVGNLRLGVEGGRRVYLADPSPDQPAPSLNFGGAFDVYVPTAAAAKNDFCLGLDACDAVALVRDLHAYEPEAFTDDAMFFKGRFHADASWSVVNAGLELSLTPGLTLDDDPELLLLFGWVVRASVAAGPHLEPYLEVGSALHLAGRHEIITILNPDRTVRSLLGQDYTTPVLLTLGARAHLSGFDPALFVAIDLRDGYVIFGLDLASVLSSSSQSARERGETRDFLRGLD